MVTRNVKVYEGRLGADGAELEPDRMSEPKKEATRTLLDWDPADDLAELAFEQLYEDMRG